MTPQERIEAHEGLAAIYREVAKRELNLTTARDNLARQERESAEFFERMRAQIIDLKRRIAEDDRPQPTPTQPTR